MTSPTWSPQAILEREGRAIVPGSVTSHRAATEPRLVTLAARAVRDQVRALLP